MWSPGFPATRANESRYGRQGRRTNTNQYEPPRATILTDVPIGRGEYYLESSTCFSVFVRPADESDESDAQRDPRAHDHELPLP